MLMPSTALAAARGLRSWLFAALRSVDALPPPPLDWPPWSVVET
jgi:hypothetical protein